MALRIVMLGGPGAGKGTQAVRLAEALKIPQISTGDIFRKNLKEGTELGKKAQVFMSAGQLVPDDLTCDIVADRLTEPDCAQGFILDGFPRSMGQAVFLRDALAARAEKIDCAIDIDVADDVIIDRLSARRVCPDTGTIYNMKFNPPSAEIAAKVIQREDDKPDTIRERLAVYHKTTKPVKGFYEAEHVLRTVDCGDMTPDEVFVRVLAIVEGL